MPTDPLTFPLYFSYNYLINSYHHWSHTIVNLFHSRASMSISSTIDEYLAMKRNHTQQLKYFQQAIVLIHCSFAWLPAMDPTPWLSGIKQGVWLYITLGTSLSIYNHLHPTLKWVFKVIFWRCWTWTCHAMRYLIYQFEDLIELKNRRVKTEVRLWLICNIKRCMLLHSS